MLAVLLGWNRITSSILLKDQYHVEEAITIPLSPLCLLSMEENTYQHFKDCGDYGGVTALIPMHHLPRGREYWILHMIVTSKYAPSASTLSNMTTTYSSLIDLD